MCPQALDPLSTACSCVCWPSSPTSVPQWAWPQRSAPCCFQARPLLTTNSCLLENSLPGITHQPWFLLPSTDLPHSLAMLAFFDFLCSEDLVSLMTTASHCQLPTLGSLAQEPTLCLLPPLLSSSLPPGTPAPAHHPHLHLANSLPGSSAGCWQAMWLYPHSIGCTWLYSLGQTPILLRVVLCQLCIQDCRAKFRQPKPETHPGSPALLDGDTRGTHNTSNPTPSAQVLTPCPSFISYLLSPNLQHLKLSAWLPKP